MKKIILSIIIISFFLGGCTIGAEEEVGLEESELNFLISEAGSVALPLTKYHTLNPLINDNEAYFYFSKLIYEGLFDFDENLKPVVELAETYEIEDGRRIIIKLREDVLWHDGEGFTARDVKFTVDALRYGSENIYWNLIASFIESNNIISANIIDEYNIEISFAKESPNLLGLLTFPILAEHEFLNQRMALDENAMPLGTGPFILDKTSSTKDIQLLANKNYRFDTPRIEKVIGRVLDDDLFTTSFEAGKIDITISSRVDWDRYKQNNSIDVIEFISSDYEFLGFNFNNGIFSEDKGQAVRKAIIYAIDRKNIIENVYLGHASQVDLPLHPNSWTIADSVNTYGYDIATSRRHLSSAGFEDMDGDGILEDENGNKLVFRYLTNPSNPYRRRTAELIKSDLKEIGIEIILDYNTRTEEDYSSEIINSEWEVIKDKIERSDFDIVQLGLNMSIIPDIGHLFHSNGNSNFINYSDEKMDSLIIDYESQNGISKANEELQSHLVNELPYISLFYKNKAMLINSKIIGDLNPTHYNPYNGLENCFTTVKGH